MSLVLGGGIPENGHGFQSPHSTLTHACRDLTDPHTGSHGLPGTCGVDSRATWRPALGDLGAVGARASVLGAAVAGTGPQSEGRRGG